MVFPLLLISDQAVPTTLPTPTGVASTEVALAPSAALKAATLAELGAHPREPIGFRFICAIRRDLGNPDRCIPADGAAPASNWAEFDRQSLRFQSAMTEATANEVERAAYTRVRWMRLQRDPKAADTRRLVILTTIVSPSDALPDLAPAPRIPRSDVRLVEVGDGGELGASLYPEQALRIGWGARVTMLCRIQQDLGILCRDGSVVVPERDDVSIAQRLEMSREFIFASYQYSSLVRAEPLVPGAEIVGRDVEYSISWAVPWNPHAASGGIWCQQVGRGGIRSARLRGEGRDQALEGHRWPTVTPRPPMNVIRLDASQWRRPDDFYAALLPQLGAPPWHGRNLDALFDSLSGGINFLEPPFSVEVEGTGELSGHMAAFLTEVAAIFDDAREGGAEVSLILK